MKKVLTILAAMLLAIPTLRAQSADAILGEYECFDKGNESRIRFTKAEDGTYSGTLFWLKDDLDPATGDCWKDSKNPDKSLRSRYTHSICIVSGLKYNVEKNIWEKGKIYDPNRGIKVACTGQFTSDKVLEIRGSVLGIGETIVWHKM